MWNAHHRVRASVLCSIWSLSVALFHVRPSRTSSSPSKHVIITPLDHFGDKEDTWPLTYYVDNSSFIKGKALVLVMPSESALSGAEQASLNMFIQAPWATSMNATVVTFEHRFFGSSIPKNGKSLQANYQYLSVEQSLKDALYLIDHLRSLTSYDHVVAAGGSYPGALAAWIRRTYPEKVDAAIAQSAVVEAFMDFPQYGISNLVALSSPDSRCANYVSRGMQSLRHLYRREKKWLFEKFNQSALLNDGKLGDFTFMQGVVSFDEFVQAGRKNLICATMAESTNDYTFDSDSDKEWADVMSSAIFNIINHRIEGAFDKLAPNPWWWLKCTQLGWFKTGPRSGFSANPFDDLNVAKFLDTCGQLFPGASLLTDTKVAQFNKQFGGADQHNATHVFMIDFSDDPWKMATTTGIIERQNWALGEEQPFMLSTCDGCSHCGDGAPEAVIQQINEQVVYYLTKWLRRSTRSQTNNSIILV